MNQIHSVELGGYLRRLPLTKAPNIVNGNALRLDWNTIVPKKDDNLFILGNPPFSGKKEQQESQKEDFRLVYGDNKLYDAYRTLQLKEYDIKIIRFRNEEVLDNLDGVIVRLKDLIPDPSPEGEGK